MTTRVVGRPARVNSAAGWAEEYAQALHKGLGLAHAERRAVAAKGDGVDTAVAPG